MQLLAGRGLRGTVSDREASSKSARPRTPLPLPSAFRREEEDPVHELVGRGG